MSTICRDTVSSELRTNNVGFLLFFCLLAEVSIFLFCFYETEREREIQWNKRNICVTLTTDLDHFSAEIYFAFQIWVDLYCPKFILAFLTNLHYYYSYELNNAKKQSWKALIQVGNYFVYTSLNIAHRDLFLTHYFVALMNEVECFCFFITNDSNVQNLMFTKFKPDKLRLHLKSFLRAVLMER